MKRFWSGFGKVVALVTAMSFLVMSCASTSLRPVPAGHEVTMSQVRSGDRNPCHPVAVKRTYKDQGVQYIECSDGRLLKGREVRQNTGQRRFASSHSLGGGESFNQENEFNFHVYNEGWPWWSGPLLGVLGGGLIGIGAWQAYELSRPNRTVQTWR